MKKVYKKVEQDNGTITFYGGRVSELHYGENPDIDDVDQYFTHYGRRYWLSDFTRIGFAGGCVPAYIREFDGYLHDSFFSGVAIKLGEDGESVMACTFIG